MKTHRINEAIGLAVLAGLALWVNVTRAQTVDDYIVDQFGDDVGVQSWSRAWGLTPTFEWDSAENSDGNPAGALKVTIPFDILTYQGNDNQCAFQRALADTIDFELYTKIHFDIKIDPSSGRLSVSWGAGQFGGIDLVARNSDWSVQLNNITTADPWLGVDDYGVWRHQALTVDPTLTTHHNMSALMFHIWSGWWDAATQTGGLTNTVTFWVDNLYFEKNTNTAPVPPPTVSVKPAASGLQLIASQSGSQYQRQGIRTVEDNKSWVGATGPVTYELTIKEAPMKDGFQAHMFLIPNSTGDTAPDWGNPDAACILIYDNGAGAGQINFGFKTNEANGNSQIYGANHLAALDSTKILGTWKVAFDNDTSVTLTAPDGASTNFAMAAEAVARFANPLTVYFGAQPGNLDYIGSGYVFSNVKITGVPSPIDDSFTGADLDPLIWAKAAENTAGVLIAPPSAKCWLTWTLPAVGFGPQASSALVGAPWTELDLGKSFKNGSLQTMLLSAADLPAGNDAFLRMIKRPFTKLQVLMPGETAAPGTTTGKTGTPTAQTSGVEFDVVVNAVDDNWYLASAGRDVVNLTSTDAAATLPADAALVNGTGTFKVTLWSAGSWTVTATDVTDPTKTANTSSPVTVQ
jgi:hypothetical protein